MSEGEVHVCAEFFFFSGKSQGSGLIFLRTSLVFSHSSGLALNHMKYYFVCTIELILLFLYFLLSFSFSIQLVFNLSKTIQPFFLELFQLFDNFPYFSFLYNCLHQILMIFSLIKLRKHFEHVIDIFFLLSSHLFIMNLLFQIQQTSANNKLFPPYPLVEFLVVDIYQFELHCSLLFGVIVCELHLSQ